jgi:cytochrome c551/c552
MVIRYLTVLATISLAVSAMSAQKSSHGEIFATSDQCMACHNGLRTPSGEDVSIGASWRASMMANSSRDPYWQAGVRREVIDHPAAAASIQDECATCHMPMARTEAKLDGHDGAVFEHLPVSSDGDRSDRLAHDGVACSLCHQITDRNFGTPAGFTGGYVVTVPRATAAGPSAKAQARPMFGPFKIERGLTTIMRSATGFEPTEALHIRQSELCASCHTLVTKARGPTGDVIGELPEQMPFLEWKHSAFAAEQRSCQSCHMPVAEEDTPIASVLGAPRKGFARHTFVGGNAFMQRMLNRYRDELGVLAPPAEMESSIRATLANLQQHTAELSIDRVERSPGRLVADVRVENLTGHKLPTGYPSRRAWLHVTVRDRGGRTVFESGAVAPDGSIAGNDNDADAFHVEPHHVEIRTPDEVQIYESVMSDTNGRPTTGLLNAVRYLKDNRLLPRGFDKSTADPWISVVGTAAGDVDFKGGADRVRYEVTIDDADAPFQLDVALRFQVISFRWAENLRPYKAEETSRFVKYFESMASSSSELLVARRQVVK